MKYSGIVGLVSQQMELKAEKRKYIDDPVLWAKDYLGVQLWSAQGKVAMSLVDNKNVVVKAGHEVGKAAALDTPVATPNGWSAIGELREGDYVFDERGKPTRVVGKSPIWLHDSYRVSFSDGTSVVVNGEHEWNVLDFHERKTVTGRKPVSDWREFWGSTKTLETREIHELGVLTPGNQLRWKIPNGASLEMPDAELPIDPYVLGAWLGDGTTTAVAITSHPDDHEIIDRIAQTETVTKMANKYAWSLAGGRGSRKDESKLGFRMRALNLIGNKHIPAQYLRASTAQRIDLLRGLMDTDGTISAKGTVQIDLCDKTLAYDVVELINSLGWLVRVNASDAKLYGRVTSTRYRINFRPSVNPFHLKRKAERWSEPKAQASRHTARTITAIELLEKPVPTQCIEVDSESHLFLLGKQMVPTHNSFLAGILICWWVDTHWDLPGGCFVVSTAPSSKQINAIVWREVRRFHELSQKRFKEGLVDHPLPGYITSQAKWKLDNGIELGYGSKPPDSKEDTMSGIHARYVLAVGDEAVGLSEALIDDLGNITSNATSRRFLICNPTNPLSYVAKIFKSDITSWAKHTISVFDSPNFHGGEGLPVEVLESLVDQSYVDDKIAEWGEEYEDEATGRMLSRSPKFISRVMGEFAWDMGFTLIRPEDMAKGLDCDIRPSLESRPVLGVDVSRSKAGDKNTIYRYLEGQLRLIDSWNEPNAMQTAQKIHEYALASGATEVRIDGTGLGGPIADRVVELSEGRYTVIEMIGGAASPDRARWFNARAYWYWSFADRLGKGEIDIALEDEQLQEELLGIEIKKRSAGIDSLLIESKDDMRKRGVGSPDYADGAIYAAADLSYILDAARSGDVVAFDPQDFLYERVDDLRGMPV